MGRNPSGIVSDISLVDRIMYFWLCYGYKAVDVDQLRTAIKLHLKYKTCEVVEVGDKIVGICRYDIDGHDVKVYDCLIHPDYYNKRILKLMLLRGLKKFPHSTHLVYMRTMKARSDYRRTSIMKLLKLKGASDGR